jgi:hypothetical protein
MGAFFMQDGIMPSTVADSITNESQPSSNNSGVLVSFELGEAGANNDSIVLDDPKETSSNSSSGPESPFTADQLLDTIVHYRFKRYVDPQVEDPNGLLKQLPAVFSAFDWVQHQNIYKEKGRMPFLKKKHRQPQSILCHPFYIKNLVGILLKMEAEDPDKVFQTTNLTLVLAGGDTHATVILEEAKQALQEKGSAHHDLFDLADKVWIEAKDVYDDRIQTIPMGLNMHYVLRNGLDNVVAAIAAVQAPHFDESKELVCASWGQVSTQLDAIIPERASLLKLVEKPNSWVNKSNWKPTEYWDQLSRYHFFLAPRGKGIQSPKLAEAWLVHTIPVSVKNPAFEDLKAMGFPMLLVDSWDDLNPAVLQESLRTEFAQVDWGNVYKMLSVDYVGELLKL